MERVPEPELMEGAAQAAAYASADFGGPNTLFCEQLKARFELPADARWLDLGCGPADIPLRLCRVHPGWRIVAVDGSQAMLVHARRRVHQQGLASQIELVEGLLGRLALPERAFDGVLSNSLLHHLHAPDLLWHEAVLRARPGAMVLVMDLLRPPHEDAVRQLVADYAGDEPAVLQHDFAASLRAAFTLDEVKDQLARARLPQLHVERISDRHLIVHGRL